MSFGYYGGVLRAVYLDDAAELPAPEPRRGAEDRRTRRGALAPRSVGAMAAVDGHVGAGRPRVVVAASRCCCSPAGVAPLVCGLGVFGVLAA